MTEIAKPELSLQDPSLCERWDLEARYPAVTDIDLLRCDVLKKQLQLSPVLHDMRGVVVELTHDMPAYLGLLLLNNAYEHGDISLIRKYVREGRAMVLGGGIGVIATALAQQTNQPVAVVEANDALAPALARTAELNQVSLDFRHGAVVPGASAGKISFTVSEEFWASSLRESTYKAQQTITAPVVNMAQLMAEVRPSVLFVDIEGAEVGLFSQLSLAGVDQLFVEIHRPNLCGAKWAEVIADITRQGFVTVDASGLTCYFERT